jgi:hypothetical protein
MTQRLQDLADAGAVIIGRAARCGLARGPATLRPVLGKEVTWLMRGLRIGETGFCGSKGGAGTCIRRAYIEGFLDGGQRFFGCVFGFLRDIRHIGRRLVFTPDCRRGPNRQEIRELSREHGTVAAAVAARIPDLLPSDHPIALATRRKQRRLGLFLSSLTDC